MDAAPCPLLARTSVTHVAADAQELYVHAFAGGRISVVSALGRVLAAGAADKVERQRSSVLVAVDGQPRIAVPFASEHHAAHEAEALREALGRPAETLGSASRPAALPSSRPPLTELVAEPLRHVTDIARLSPEACFHLAVALSAAPPKDVALRGYVSVALPEGTRVLYRLRGFGGKVVAVGGQVPMLVWREESGSGGSLADRRTLLARLKAAYAPLAAAWADPVLCPSVPCRPDEAFETTLGEARETTLGEARETTLALFTLASAPGPAERD
jgi:hypothetical protein